MRAYFSLPVARFGTLQGVSLRRMNLSAQVQRGINIAMALAMLGVVALAALSTR